MRYALNVSGDGHILSACVVLEKGNYEGMPIVDMLPDGDITDYLYQDGAFVYDPLPEPEPADPEPTELEQMRADIDYIAMETGVEL